MPLLFEPINLDKQRAYLAYLRQCPQKTSDYSFINLWAWSQEYGLCWAWEKDLVWIKQTRPQPVYWAPVGPWEKIDWQSRLSPFIHDQNTFIRIPENLMQCWQSSVENHIQVIEARGHWDYLYSIEALIQLRGNRFHKKKNLLNQFTKKYNYTYTPIEPETIVHAAAMQKDWCHWRDCESSNTLSAENRAIIRVFNQWNNLNGLIGGSITVDQTIAAYTVAERLTNDMLLIHFEKASPMYKGGYQAINQMFLSRTRGEIKTVNREQDLDDEGLRQAKLSYHPLNFLRKFMIILSSLSSKG